MGEGPSVAAQLLPEATPMREGVGRVLDVGLAPLAAAGLGYAGIVGAGADLAEAAGVPRADALADDLMAMPEAFAGSIGSLATGPGAKVSKIPSKKVPKNPSKGDSLEPDLESTISLAAKGGRKSREKLAAQADVNVDAVAQAERLKIDLPVDVLADDAVIKEAAGMLRGIRGSEEAAEWSDTFSAARSRAAEIISDAGATGDLSAQSEAVRTSLTTSIDSLRASAAPVYESIKNSVPKGHRVQPSETVKAFNGIVEGLGGVEALTKSERHVYKILTSDEGITYERLIREKDQIARAAFQNAGPYADADQRTARALYNAMKDDQRNFVETTVGADAVKKLDGANNLWAQAKDLEESLIKGFGKDTDGSLSAKIRSALTTGSKGDIKGLNAVLKVTPETLRKDVIMTGLESLSQSRSGQGGFSFPEFAKLYREHPRHTPKGNTPPITVALPRL